MEGYWDGRKWLYPWQGRGWGGGGGGDSPYPPSFSPNNVMSTSKMTSDHPRAEKKGIYVNVKQWGLTHSSKEPQSDLFIAQ